MQRTLFITVLIIKSIAAWGQVDANPVKDLTAALVLVNDDGSLQPVLDKSAHRAVGFFLTKNPSQQIRLCNDHPVSLWVDGRLIKRITKGCEIFWFDDLFEFSNNAANYVSLYAEKGFKELSVEIIDTQTKKMDNNFFETRFTRNQFREFTIIGAIFLITAFGFLTMRFQNRIKYVLSKSFSFKFSSYELADIRFFSTVGISFGLFLSALVGFFWVYFQFRFPSDFAKEINLPSLGIRWLNASISILILLLLKWLLSSMLSRLFSFGRIYEYQIFDLINVCLSFCSLLLGLFVVDFLFDWRIKNWNNQEVSIFMSGVMAFTILFLGLKFVTNHPHKKLLIISYLCATEIIPAIILIGWFYK